MIPLASSLYAQRSRGAKSRAPWHGLRTLFAGLLVTLLASFIGTVQAADDLPTLPITVNVNTADARTIANVLQGVGLSRAAAIVAYREQHGAFKQVDELGKVKGVGDRTLELNATRILLKD